MAKEKEPQKDKADKALEQSLARDSGHTRRIGKDDDVIESPNMLLTELRGMIGSAREQVAQAVNATLIMLYWQIGKRIQHEILGERRADYGKQIVAALGRQLASEFGAGFGEKNLRAKAAERSAQVEWRIFGQRRRSSRAEWRAGWCSITAMHPAKRVQQW